MQFKSKPFHLLLSAVTLHYFRIKNYRISVLYGAGSTLGNISQSTGGSREKKRLQLFQPTVLRTIKKWQQARVP